jgi:uncharacterized protein YjiK
MKCKSYKAESFKLYGKNNLTISEERKNALWTFTIIRERQRAKLQR